MQLLDSSAASYEAKYGFQFVMYVPPECTVASVIAAIADRMHHDTETERKVLRNEIAKLNRSRLERMLGPEGGYDNWA
jgi:2-oxo-4-hydroxy-4-carboxy--5-ureidoimidazoline (OHCU) decarboxylase